MFYWTIKSKISFETEAFNGWNNYKVKPDLPGGWSLTVNVLTHCETKGSNDQMSKYLSPTLLDLYEHPTQDFFIDCLGQIMGFICC